MQGLAALLVPAVLMLFAVAMDRVQCRLDKLSVSPAHVDEFLADADEEDVNNLAKAGFPAALDELRDRRAGRDDHLTESSETDLTITRAFRAS
ncbi:hypothetical protein [Gordonia sp. (in: high G+C Gram-positive bacteria)]|jgi:hypothetical protein|uniref:hypothetical protein n=1 Tax=Gordonia sp. (in: high G+C Gram-positive bacteria) TaxID=84139 RepID=UPI001D1E9EE5|nr:hypothetical protein [Gordonia sp. (in: high G+C Gram-positive bacteria)]MCB1294463.1 hypothetical protein [Gordonia sp. (in: high G+C Gram-positive bacteria)]HMS77671.1 hypothetical protein [Gordonia sp. (in: high G+C Gram-positive bacteria)]HQV19465.1 hypothetical protein [Gordonia sp. (in: high G+C Gram-positive bacteria)]